jgi:hypothetical protein
MKVGRKRTKRTKSAKYMREYMAKRRKYKGPEGTVGVFARISVEARDLLEAATEGSTKGRGLGNGNRVTLGTVLERCIVQALAPGAS